MDRGIRLKLPVHRFFLTATNNRKEISTLCRLVEKSLVRGNRCIRSGIYNPFPFPFVSFSFPSKNALAEGKEWRTNRWQISFYSFSFPNSLFKHNIQQNLMDRQICICYPFIFSYLFLFPNSIMEIEIHLANDYLLTFNSINCAFLRIFSHPSLFFFILHARRLFL